jgi:hypothetical protein
VAQLSGIRLIHTGWCGVISHSGPRKSLGQPGLGTPKLTRYEWYGWRSGVVYSKKEHGILTHRATPRAAGVARWSERPLKERLGSPPGCGGV